jgi:hypothetical protein
LANRLGIRGRLVELYVRFVDAAGNPVNADDIPRVEISDDTGTVRRTLNKSGVGLADDPGLYLLTYEIPLAGPDGYWNDRWVAVIGGETVENTFEFQVIEGGDSVQSALPKNVPGDDYEFTFTKEEVNGINKLLKILKKRLKSDGTRKAPDPDDPTRFIDVPCPVFRDSELICFLVNGLSEFNQYPHFTNFTFADDAIQNMFMDIIIQGALILALAAQALIERGREFSITDNGVTYQPPQLSEILNTQYNAQLTDYKEKLKMIKCNLKPSPLGLGTFRVTSVSPAYARLRHLRERQII